MNTKAIDFNKGQYVYLGILGVYLLGLLFFPQGATVLKPLLLGTLIALYVSGCAYQGRHFDPLVLLALMFSWVGDALLMFEGQMFFILGLIGFLLAHLFYSVWFYKEMKRKGIKMRWWLAALVALYGVALVGFLWGHLGALKLPVAVYATVISVMLITAVHAAQNDNRALVYFDYLIYGAKLFVISDSLLAINKFYAPFPGAGFFIMLTYGLAQFFLVKGILQRQSGPK